MRFTIAVRVAVAVQPIMLTGPRLDPQGKPTHLVVLLHGYGADGNDLIGLAEPLRAILPSAAFTSPHAPERAPQGPGHQWFALSRIDPHEMRGGAERAAPALNEYLDAELARLSLDASKLALIGFSQGTMMALHVGLSRKVPPAAIIGFSGVLVAPDAVPTQTTTPILLAHGDSDTVVPPGALFEAASKLGRSTLVRWHLSAGMAHGIDEAGLGLAGDFLRDAFAGRLAPTIEPAQSLVKK